MKMPTWKLILTAALIVGCAVLIQRHRSRTRELARLAAIDSETFLVRTEKAQVRDIEEKLVLVGTVKALEEAVLFPRVDGKLRKNLVAEGQPVLRDQAVAMVERDEVGVVYEPAPVPSTIDGVVGKTYQDPGANVTPQTPIALVVNQSQVRVKVDLPERYLGLIAAGQAAHLSVDAYQGRRFNGKVFRVSPVVDPASRSAAIEVLAGNADGRLKSGMFAVVELVVGKRASALSVSADSVQSDGRNASVVFLAEGAKAAARPVTVGVKTPEYAEILRGIKPGDLIISSGLYGLKDGSKIEVIE
ncbi:MAG: efflux RND transporter periplasmic adaptor subunit [Elusimicrobia bacterium]|nr:efflux RND transporter periplasmic adaptor subunit [Elusimicrobiota bacterium]